ncbi:MAG: DUF1080 domain-containing protein [Verrucomicrobiota bacterium]|nr:DUF1080 domain-containing protein [Verrucomicrobiota bacterium]
MKLFSFGKVILLSAFLFQARDGFSENQNETGFVPIFDGQSLNGWKLMDRNGLGYAVTNGIIFCARGGGGNLFTEKEYEDFILRFEFRLEAGSNNGIGIRAPYEGDAAYLGMEIQVLDDTTKKYGTLRPEQHHGSIYDVVAAKVGFQKPVGEWNVEEITAQGRHIKVVLNGTTITDANLNDVADSEILQRHPGLFRERGHIGFLGHNDYVEYRNLRVKELPVSHRDNIPPSGFVALFNGKDLTGWKGLGATPPKRAKMSAAELAAAQKKEDENMRSHWKVEDGVLVFDGQGKNLCSEKDFSDFELMADWKIEPKGDSGIYLRGCPQVQIWDYTDTGGKKDHSVGSGGLHNNLKNPSTPLQRADHAIGQWNHFRILMTGEKVHVFLNNELVVTNTTLENSWERDKPVYPTGPIELQNHHDPLYFKNIYVRELLPKTN